MLNYQLCDMAARPNIIIKHIQYYTNLGLILQNYLDRNSPSGGAKLRLCINGEVGYVVDSD